MKVYSLGIRPLQAFRLGTDRNLAENSWCNFQIGFSWKFFSHRPNSATHLASQRQPMPVCNCGPNCHNLSLSMAVRQYHEDTSCLQRLVQTWLYQHFLDLYLPQAKIDSSIKFLYFKLHSTWISWHCCNRILEYYNSTVDRALGRVPRKERWVTMDTLKYQVFP